MHACCGQHRRWDVGHGGEENSEDNHAISSRETRRRSVWRWRNHRDRGHRADDWLERAPCYPWGSCEAMVFWGPVSFARSDYRQRQWSRTFPNRPLSHGSHFGSQENKKLCFCPSSLAQVERLNEQNLVFQHYVIKVYGIKVSVFLKLLKKILKSN